MQIWNFVWSIIYCKLNRTETLNDNHTKPYSDFNSRIPRNLKSPVRETLHLHYSCLLEACMKNIKSMFFTDKYLTVR